MSFARDHRGAPATTLVVALALAGIALAACTGDRARRPPGAAAHDSADPAAAARLATCGAEHLGVRIRGMDAGAGQRTIAYALVNLGDSACTLAGRPLLQLASADRRSVVGTSQLPKNGPDTLMLLQLAPGAAGRFMLHFSHIPTGTQPCAHVDSVSILVSGLKRPLVIGDTMTVCGGASVSELRPDSVGR